MRECDILAFTRKHWETQRQSLLQPLSRSCSAETLQCHAAIKNTWAGTVTTGRHKNNLHSLHRRFPLLFLESRTSSSIADFSISTHVEAPSISGASEKFGGLEVEGCQGGFACSKQTPLASELTNAAVICPQWTLHSPSVTASVPAHTLTLIARVVFFNLLA